MTVMEVEDIGKQRFRIHIEGAESIILYKSEVDRYRLKAHEVLSFAQYEEIIENTVLRRARQKALALLKYMDRTEYELTLRLVSEGYPREVVRRTLDYVRSFHYLDDLRYSEAFIRTKSHTKSSRQIKALLKQKGVSDEIIEKALAFQEESEESAELEAIRRAIRKKAENAEALTKEERLKLCASLYRKGFKMENIRKVFHLYEDDI